MKNILIALMLMACLIVPAMAENAEIAEPEIVSVPAKVALAYKDGSINLRAGEGTQYDIVTALKHDEAITVITYGDVWSKVATEKGKEGYIKNLYINDGNLLYAAGIEYYGTSREMTAYIGVNMYAGASGETALIVALEPGAEVTALGENGSYTLVSTEDGAQGFVKSSYLK